MNLLESFLEEYLGIKASNSYGYFNSENLIIVEKFNLNIFLKNVFRLNRLRVVDKTTSDSLELILCLDLNTMTLQKMMNV